MTQSTQSQAPTTDVAATRKVIESATTIGSLLSGLQELDSAPITDVDRQVPREIELSADVREALENLPALMQAAQFPAEARELTADEISSLVPLGKAVVALNQITNKLKDEALKPAVFNHLDRLQERNRQVNGDTPRDSKGYYVTKGEDRGLVREVRAGTPSVDAQALSELVDAGELTKRQFLGMTRQVRVVDENAFLAFVSKNVEKMPVLRKAIRYTRAASVSMKFR